MQSLNILALLEYTLKDKFTIKEESGGFYSMKMWMMWSNASFSNMVSLQQFAASILPTVHLQNLKTCLALLGDLMYLSWKYPTKALGGVRKQ